jgi:type II restriction/modification system DNA methylase subunit YeeA
MTDFVKKLIQTKKDFCEIKKVLEQKKTDINWQKIDLWEILSIPENDMTSEQRRESGTSYTSVENIHKVIDPLFLDNLKQEFDILKQIKDSRTKTKKLLKFQNYISTLTFFDPACGSGNFLTQIYISLRKLENQIIKILIDENIPAEFIKIKVNIGQFYGIEINDFATQVAKTALWIAESQMFCETEKILSSR